MDLNNHHHFSMLEFSCDDVPLVAKFWSALLELDLEVLDENYAQFSPQEPAPKWLFIRRSRQTGNSMTIALTSSDLEGSTERAVAAGAAAHGMKVQDGFRWSELEDPEGNPFTFNAPPVD